MGPLYFLYLCYDYHPSVKIRILEDVILKFWLHMPFNIQDKWLKIVVDMLDDPIVRAYTSMGLIGQSEFQDHYHENHNRQQMLRWFIAIAPKLLEHRFMHQIYFDKFLTVLDKDFPILPSPYRTKLLESITDYIERSNDLSEHTLYSIEQIVLKGEPSNQESDICLRLIRNLSSWGKSRIAFTFAREYPNLCDKRFQEFVHYPFYNEDKNQYVAERCAALLGLLTNSNITLEDLPPPLRSNDFTSVTDVISEYALEQNDRFQLLLFMMAYNYGRAYHIGTSRDDCFQLDIVDQFIRKFSDVDDTQQSRTVVEVILKKIDLFGSGIQDQPIADLKKTRWFEYVELFLYHRNSEICKIVCELIFASNIASCVHNKKTFLHLVFLALTHSDKSVSRYAFSLFDKHFHEIFQCVFYRGYPELWTAEINKAWLADEFQQYLLDNSSSYRKWRVYLNYWGYLEQAWGDFSQEHQYLLIKHLLDQICSKETLEIMELARQFYARVGVTLTEDQRAVIDVYFSGDHLESEIICTQQMSYKEELNSFFSKVNWSIYFDD